MIPDIAEESVRSKSQPLEIQNRQGILIIHIILNYSSFIIIFKDIEEDSEKLSSNSLSPESLGHANNKDPLKTQESDEWDDNMNLEAKSNFLIF